MKPKPSPKLRPCPFCGHDDISAMWTTTRAFLVRCLYCYVEMLRYQKSAAIKAWNRRARP